ncbi:MAG: glycosyltransferase [Candidatus Cloacimonadia bacterium]
MQIATLVLTIICVASLIVYVRYLLVFTKGIKRGKELPENYRKRSVSVVVAARNEEDNIARTLTSLVNQSYPQELYEIIVIDDRSTDRTADIIREFAKKWDNIQLVQIKDAISGWSPKKYALTQGIEKGKGEIILLTDADCLVTKYWIEAMVTNFRDGVSMVSGFSRVRLSNWKRSSLVNRFEYFDFVLMFIAAGGAILSDRYFSCSNQNLGYLRSAFDEVGGFDKIKHILSGDDVNLLQLFRKSKLKVTFSLNKHSFAYTEPVDSLSHLISQRSRWASNAKWQLFLNPEFFFYLLAVFLLHVTSIALLFFNWTIALIFFALRYLSDFTFAKKHFDQFEEESKRLRFFPIWFLLQPWYLIVVTVRGMLGAFKWKSS